MGLKVIPIQLVIWVDNFSIWIFLLCKTGWRYTHHPSGSLPIGPFFFFQFYTTRIALTSLIPSPTLILWSPSYFILSANPWPHFRKIIYSHNNCLIYNTEQTFLKSGINVDLLSSFPSTTRIHMLDSQLNILIYVLLN